MSAGHFRVVGLLVALSVLAGCCAPIITDRVILLPQSNGRPSAVEVTAGGQTLRLDQPFATAELSAGRLTPSTSSAESVRDSYGVLLAQLPARPRSFTVQFEPNGNQLAAGADVVVAEMRAALAALPASEVVIIGHTDRVGAVEANDKLSLARAEAVRDILAAAGVPREVMVVAGRGEREPVVPTADEVAEARNRRVEIKVR